jgi:hypothetical protein
MNIQRKIRNFLPTLQDRTLVTGCKISNSCIQKLKIQSHLHQ